MKTILYMATSIDGFIAKKDGDSDWVSEVDSVNFEKKMKEIGCFIVGRRTFDQYRGDIYPVSDVDNIVLTTKNLLKTDDKNVVYVRSPSEAIRAAERRGHHKVLLIGGGTTNGLFLREGLIDEVFLSVHPLILGDGIKLFRDVEKDIKLKFIDQKRAGDGLIQLHYQVINKK